MSDFDLIPTDYRQQMRLTAVVRLLVLITGGVLLLLLAGYGVLKINAAKLQDENAALAQRLAVLNAEKLQLAQLETDVRALQQSTRELQLLRAGGDPANLLHSLDRALVSGAIQISDLRFERPAAGGDNPAPPSGRLSLQGHALSHAMLSRFVNGLQSQPSFSNIRLVKAELAEDDARGLLNFIILLDVALPATGGAS